jgi:hypothetical protein
MNESNSIAGVVSQGGPKGGQALACHALAVVLDMLKPVLRRHADNAKITFLG